MKHEFFSDGTTKKISWVIHTGDSQVEQTRKQAEIYLDKVNDEQAKYIALHVGIFWGIGTFIIKNEDVVTVKLDSKSMYEHLANNSEISDPFIQTRSEFIKRLIDQRKLDVKYHLIEPKNNPASKLL
ncbi:MAG TPA: hypothetical protein VFG25_06080 [Nitrosopumilaceae archaeon]|nr:hypothetical protein [Nitrosopumilaceae archaeon]